MCPAIPVGPSLAGSTRRTGQTARRNPIEVAVPSPIVPYVEYDEVEAICSDCGRTFRSEEALELHRAESHQPIDTTTPPIVPKVARTGRVRPRTRSGGTG
jgi:hypothetical protein